MYFGCKNCGGRTWLYHRATHSVERCEVCTPGVPISDGQRRAILEHDPVELDEYLLIEAKRTHCDCISCGGRGGWYSEDNGQWVGCANYIPCTPEMRAECELTACRSLLEENIRTIAEALRRLSPIDNVSLEIRSDANCDLRTDGRKDATYSPAEIARMLAAIVVTFRERESDVRP
jgi:ribosomal protein S27E